MEIRKQTSIGSRSFYVNVDEPNICPLCKHAIRPVTLSFNSYQDEKNNSFHCATYLCKSCYKAFLYLYYQPDDNSLFTRIIDFGPSRFEKRKFPSEVCSLSPRFVDTYNQAFAAEESQLAEIAGMGYRKALEILIKDYLIHKTPDDREVIVKTPLGTCINQRVKSDNIKAVASRSAWLGNDQTHYEPLHLDRGIEDLKRFIEAAVYWIQMELVTEDALSIERRDR